MVNGHLNFSFGQLCFAAKLVDDFIVVSTQLKMFRQLLWNIVSHHTHTHTTLHTHKHTHNHTQIHTCPWGKILSFYALNAFNSIFTKQVHLKTDVPTIFNLTRPLSSLLSPLQKLVCTLCQQVSCDKSQSKSSFQCDWLKEANAWQARVGVSVAKFSIYCFSRYDWIAGFSLYLDWGLKHIERQKYWVNRRNGSLTGWVHRRLTLWVSDSL